jgi:ubiquinone/menaquinone biosynthesis C-methylase UbiE
VSFDLIAPHYRALETITFGNALQRARILHLDKLDRPKRALVLGEGNGRFLCELLRADPEIRIDCLDASARMLRIARARVRRAFPKSLSHVRFLEEDIVSWSPSDSYDLVVTHFFLDCFEADEVRAIVEKSARAATSDAVWLLADFTLPDGKLARRHAKLWLCAMYGFFRATANLRANRLIDPTPYLRANGFTCDSRVLSRASMVKSEMWLRR